MLTEYRGLGWWHDGTTRLFNGIFISKINYSPVIEKIAAVKVNTAHMCISIVEAITKMVKIVRAIYSLNWKRIRRVRWVFLPFRRFRNTMVRLIRTYDIDTIREFYSFTSTSAQDEIKNHVFFRTIFKRFCIPLLSAPTTNCILQRLETSENFKLKYRFY